MGAKDADLVLSPTGTLYTNVSGAPTDWATNGTSLGVYDDLVFMPNVARYRARGYEDKFHMQTTEVIYLGEHPVVAVSLRQWDDDVLTRVAPNRENKGFKYPSVDPGTRMSTNHAEAMAFIPENTDDWPALLLYNAVCLLEEDAEVVMMAIQEMVLQVAFECLADGSNRVYKKDLLTNMPTL